MSDDAKAHATGHRQRLRARFLADPAALPDYELLELMLAMAQPRGDVKPAAKALLKKFKTFSGVINATADDIKATPGVGEAGLAALKVARAAAARLLKDEILNQPVLSNWQSLMDYCRVEMGREKTEQLRILFLNAKNMLIADEVQQQGTVNHTPLYPREVIKRALDLGASALILVHNHPSGDAQPSPDDVEMTNHVVDAGVKMGIRVHDHLIVTRTDVTSFKSEGLL